MFYSFFFHVIVGIEAADLTSLLEQFEETQGNNFFFFFLPEVQVGRLLNLKLLVPGFVLS